MTQKPNPTLRFIAICLGLIVVLMTYFAVSSASTAYIRSRPVEDFYKLVQPVRLDRDVYPVCAAEGSKIVMRGSTIRTSTVTGGIRVIKELIRLNDSGNGVIEEEETGVIFEGEGTLTPGIRPVVFNFEYECGALPPGNYLWRVTVFVINSRGTELPYAFDTTNFTVQDLMPINAPLFEDLPADNADLI